MNTATDQKQVRVAILVNPMSGRDVRRLAARATNMTHEAKRDIVARIAAGAHAMGATDLYVAKEPFNIAAAALEYLGLSVRCHVLDNRVTNTAADTEANLLGFLRAGCRVIVSLGGDGTNRAIVRGLRKAARNPELAGAVEDVHLIALSTGTNNVFPVLAEPTIAGMVAGLQARGALAAADVRQRCKVLHVSGRRASDTAHEVPDVGLIDAVLLRRDHVGNLLPFDADRIERILLTRALPTAIGMSPIGGLLHPVREADDGGLLVELDHRDPPRANSVTFAAPLSPGLFRTVCVRSVTPIAFNVAVPFAGPGVLALDGDRDHKLIDGHALSVEIRRDGPWMINLDAAMHWAVGQGMIARLPVDAGHA